MLLRSLNLKKGVVLGAVLLTASLPIVSDAQPELGKIPAEAIGDWRWGTINPTWFVDKSTGEYKGHGGGTSVYFSFDKAGNFKRYVYIETNSYGWKTQVFTTTEGTVEFSGDTFKLTTKVGKYKSVSNRVERHNFERAMTDEERLKDSQQVYRWKMDKDPNTGKSIMRIALGSGEYSIYQREK